MKLEEFEGAALPHLNDLHRTASRLLGNPTASQDVVQETYLQAWRAWNRFQLGTNCRAWLFKIMFNEIRHHRRKWQNPAVDAPGFESRLTYEPPISDNVTDDDLLGALAALSIEFREVVLLADVQEFSYKEIAEMLDIPMGTVMSRLNRGRTMLRTLLTTSGSRKNENGTD